MQTRCDESRVIWPLGFRCHKGVGTILKDSSSLCPGEQTGSRCFSGEVDPPLDWHRSKADRWLLSAANAARLIFPTSSISPNAYRSSIGENTGF